MQQFNDRSAVIEAVQWTGDNTAEVAEFIGGPVEDVTDPNITGGRGLIVVTDEGTVLATPRDWIVSDAQGELFTCAPDVFAGRYDPVARATTIGRVKVELDIGEALAKIEAVRARLPYGRV